VEGLLQPIFMDGGNSVKQELETVGCEWYLTFCGLHTYFLLQCFNHSWFVWVLTTSWHVMGRRSWTNREKHFVCEALQIQEAVKMLNKTDPTQVFMLLPLWTVKFCSSKIS
jgi:hypothetical protein